MGLEVRKWFIVGMIEPNHAALISEVAMIIARIAIRKMNLMNIENYKFDP